MSYQVLARKWRPKNFSTLVGQEHVARALINALVSQRLHHAYLFTGTRGVGKTTIARILAKCLNCETGITSTPCETCPTCIDINNGRFVDLIEIDAASRTKVEDTRDLLDNVNYMPVRGRYKIYLIDEVHMLSNHSFNALLKTLEEPPEHVKFLLATTDPQRLPVTVLSRCLQFNLRRMSIETIHKQIITILEAENIPFETGAITQIARAADGSLRDALSLLDQGIAYSDGKLTTQLVHDMLGTFPAEKVAELLEPLIAGDANKLLAAVAHLAEFNTDFNSALEQLISLLHQFAVAQLAPDFASNDPQYSSEIIKLAKHLSPEEVQLYYQIGLIGRKDLPLAPNPREGFEMVLLRMMAFRPVTPPVKPETREETHASSALPIPLKTDSAAPVLNQAEITNTTAPVEDSQLNWAELIPKLNLAGPTLLLAKHCQFISHEQGKIILNLAPLHSPLLTRLSEERLSEALSNYLNQPIKIVVQTIEPTEPTPAKLQEIQANKNIASARNTLEKNQNVQHLLSTFNAKIETTSVKLSDKQVDLIN